LKGLLKKSSKFGVLGIFLVFWEFVFFEFGILGGLWILLFFISFWGFWESCWEFGREGGLRVVGNLEEKGV